MIERVYDAALRALFLERTKWSSHKREVAARGVHYLVTGEDLPEGRRSNLDAALFAELEGIDRLELETAVVCVINAMGRIHNCEEDVNYVQPIAQNPAVVA